MALASCPECGQKVSDQVKSCPACGSPLQQASGLFPLLACKHLWMAHSDMLMNAFLGVTFDDSGRLRTQTGPSHLGR